MTTTQPKCDICEELATIKGQHGDSALCDKCYKSGVTCPMCEDETTGQEYLEGQGMCLDCGTKEARQ